MGRWTFGIGLVLVGCVGGKEEASTLDTAGTDETPPWTAGTTTPGTTTPGTTTPGTTTPPLPVDLSDPVAVEERVTELCPAGPGATGADLSGWDPEGRWLLASVVYYAADGSITRSATFTEQGDHTVYSLRAGGRLALDTFYASGGSTYASYDLSWVRADAWSVALCDAEYMYTVYGSITDPADPALDEGDLCSASAADPDTLVCAMALDGVRVRELTFTRL